jgi:hypothetical protein
MTNEQILKDCEFDAAYKIYCLRGRPDLAEDYEAKFGADGLAIWAKTHWPDSFKQLTEAFQTAVRECPIFYDRGNK